MKKSKCQTGQGLIEVMLAITIFGLMASVLISMATASFQGLEQGGEQTQAIALAQEGIEAVRAIRDRAWNENTYDQSAVEINGNEWIFSGEGTTETIGQFTRTISFADVCRDSSNEITACPGSYIDVHSKEIIVIVEWTIRDGITNYVQKREYITNWDSADWTEDITDDFIDGTFNDTENSTTLGDGDGAVILQGSSFTVLELEGFEIDYGNWIDDAGDCHWTRQTGGTPTNNTGPDNANTDSYYIFTETSSKVCEKNDTSSIIEGPSIDANTYTADLSFYYHMFGTDMGTLHIDVWNGSSWDSDIFTLAGQQQSNETDPYMQAVIDLDSYTNNDMKIRFRYDGVSGGRADIAIDDIEINGEPRSSGYAISGDYISNGFNVIAPAVFNVIEWSWNKSSPVCDSCTIKFQIKTAPDVSGLPGTWSAT
ncbi:hypothetical protein ACFLZ0_03120, partial [Patescibacteria group bacterium]